MAKFNDGVKYLFLAVDSLSRKIRVQPLKSKNALAAKLAFERMVDFETFEFPEKFLVDEGKEFKGEFKKFCIENEIEVYQTYSETKSCMAESYIGTLKIYYTSFLRIKKPSVIIFFKFKKLFPL